MHETPERPTDLDLHVDDTDHLRGSRGPFYAVLMTAMGGRRYGWYCTNCGSVVTAMDAMGRLECRQCGNEHKPRTWDAAYL